MNELADLYQEMILDHKKRPRNFHPMENATQSADGHNPLCGDKLTVHIHLKDGVVDDVSFEGSGCAISTASASMMTEAVKGKTVEEADRLFKTFHELVTTDKDADTGGLGKLAAFAGVRAFPMRVKCATLGWHTLESALHKGETVSTE